MISLYLFQSYLLDAVFNVLATARRVLGDGSRMIEKETCKGSKKFEVLFSSPDPNGCIKNDDAMINWFHLKSKFFRILGHSQQFSRL